MKCEVDWCQDRPCPPSVRCCHHLEGATDVGPVLKFLPRNVEEGGLLDFQGKFFMLYTDKDGNDQMSEVSDALYTRQVPIEG